ncbi:hypothetical protein F5148DRAFT_1367456 [Russula earlei]|uniref:Uncharacterized protein n=1 Tax=Russula earlei TaxID=71964 RepID=A0ACC0UBI7_9AGAM|nr:hypothetical protein F5148DRAFT_1367456 [Russula earlei]
MITPMTEPIHNMATYKTLADTIIDALNDSGMAKHAGFEKKAAQRAWQQMRLPIDTAWPGRGDDAASLRTGLAYRSLKVCVPVRTVSLIECAFTGAKFNVEPTGIAVPPPLLPHFLPHTTCIVASVDHINTALQWMSTELLAGQWLWHDLITLVPYDAELTCMDPASLRGGSAARAQSSGEGAAATAHVGEGMGMGADDANGDNGGDNDGDGGEACVGGRDAPSMQAVLLANTAVGGGVDLTTPASAVQFLYKPLTTLQLPPFSTINKPPCLALLPPLLNNLRLLHVKLSVPVALWAVLNSVGHLLAPQLPDNLFNFKDKSIITYQLIWQLKWLPFNQCLLLHNGIDKLLPLLFLPLLLLLQGPILLLLALALALALPLLLLLLSMDLTLALFPLLILLLTPSFLFLILIGSISICQLTWLLSLLLFLLLNSKEVSMSLPLLF